MIFQEYDAGSWVGAGVFETARVGVSDGTGVGVTDSVGGKLLAVKVAD